MENWVYRVSDGQVMLGVFDPSIFLTDSVNYAMVSLPDGRWPDPRLHRVNSPTSTRPATVAEQSAYDSAVRDTQANDADTNALVQAVAQLDFEERQKLTVKTGQTLRTAAECKARVKAIYRSLLGA